MKKIICIIIIVLTTLCVCSYSSNKTEEQETIQEVIEKLSLTSSIKVKKIAALEDNDQEFIILKTITDKKITFYSK